MAQARQSQVNIRSDFAAERIRTLSERTGMTVTEVVEEAVRGYTPPGAGEAPEGMEWAGPFLVFKTEGRPPISVDTLLAAIDEARDRDILDFDGD